MNVKTKIPGAILIFTFFQFFTANAATHYSLNVVGRSKPATINPTATIAYDGMLWGEPSKENPVYGYYRIGARTGGNPNLGAFFQVAPIAPLVFEISRGITNRVLKISTLDCDVVSCKGRIDRTDYIIRAVAAKSNLILLASANWREIRTDNVSQVVGLEAEFFTVTAGFHRFFETTFTLGYKLSEKDLVGLIFNNGEIAEGQRKSSSVYGVYRSKWDEYNWALGAGNYKSDMPDQDGLSIIFSVTRNFGDRLSLF